MYIGITTSDKDAIIINYLMPVVNTKRLFVRQTLDIQANIDYNCGTQLNETAGRSHRPTASRHRSNRSTAMLKDDFNAPRPNGQELSPEVLARIHEASKKPEMLVDLLIELCPGITPSFALACLKEDLAFEQEATNQAAILLGGEWATDDHNEVPK